MIKFVLVTTNGTKPLGPWYIMDMYKGNFDRGKITMAMRSVMSDSQICHHEYSSLHTLDLTDERP